MGFIFEFGGWFCFFKMIEKLAVDFAVSHSESKRKETDYTQ